MSFYIYLDSRYRTNPAASNTDFQALFNDFNLNNSDVSLSLETLTFYNVQYPINEYNSVITFAEAGDTNTLYSISITEGNYTGDDLATEMATKLNAASGNGYTYTVAYDGSTGKLTVDVGVLPNTFSWAVIDYETYGFASDVDSFSVTKTGLPINLGGTEYVDLCLPSLVHTGITNNNNSSGLFKRVPLAPSWGSLVTYETASDSDSVVVNREYLDNIRVQLRNPDGTLYLLPDNFYLSIVLKAKVIN